MSNLDFQGKFIWTQKSSLSLENEDFINWIESFWRWILIGMHNWLVYSMVAFNYSKIKLTATPVLAFRS